MTKPRTNELRAGLFVVIGVLVFTLAIFLLGRKSALFTRNTELFAAFGDISGLAVGAPVRLAGLEVGTVGAISFPADPRDKQPRVRLVIRNRFMSRIRADSEAFIDSAGLLGDKVVNISMGSPEAAELRDGASLKVRQSVSFEALSSNLGQVVSSLVNISSKVESMVGDARTLQIQGDVARITASVANVMAEVERGKGLAHRLIYDPTLAGEAQATLVNTRAATQRAEQALARVDAIAAEVQHGQGSAHELIYGQTGKATLVSLHQAVSQVDTLLRAVHEGDGVLHTLLYQPDQGNFLRDLNQMTATLNRLVNEVDQGRGTVGALLKDPTVYEDLKTLLGNVRRNVVFKALVRFTMDSEQLRRADHAPRPVGDAGVSLPHVEGSATAPHK